MRQLWQGFEALHDVVYFTPAAQVAYAELGCRGWWMGYFASRAAAVGPVGPEVVTALFFNFAPRVVERALPDAWRLADRNAVLEARRRIAGAALRELLEVDAAELAHVLDATARMVTAAPRSGRALFAATAALPRPADPIDALWHDVTALREFRGDGHVAALVTAGLSGCAANRLMFALGLVPPNQRERRGWTEQEWEQALGDLLERGWLHADGTPTREGRAAREEIEDRTDRLCEVATAAVGFDDLQAVTRTVVRLAQQVSRSGLIPYPNPTGVPAA
ncbi:MAG TPA: hypothetical protein VLR26_04190 [Frankiaceae bacterium]|nr:hypothetical protein [Frankiaceae bacterium]